MRMIDFPSSPRRPTVWRHTASQRGILLPELVRMYFELLPNTGAIALCMSVCTTWHRAGWYLLKRLHDARDGP
ncbi:hypothetical protein AURDEDRAFT_176831 [Auricularia subglabra TFB-10046 SS5]|nr:hypothetical protein AURDEDRAFT_176831 [Auricularia subglabra TFB-10046 SS5]